MIKLSNRQQNILNYLGDYQSAHRSEIEGYVKSVDDKFSKPTIIRDLNKLIELNYIKKTNLARSTIYSLSNTNNLLRKIDVKRYFQKEVDERDIKHPYFNFNIFKNLKDIFTDDELVELDNTNKIYQEKIKAYPATILNKEYERLLIELSWKSSKMEGNTYSLLDTELLIKENIQAQGHKKEEADMILNHKEALKYIFTNKDYFSKITLAKIEDLHKILVNHLDVSFGLRQKPVGIVGTNYKPLFNQAQIKEAMEKLIDCINTTKNAIEKAFIAVLMISYIQPFEDGNKRTGRILANAILYANDYCPISYRSVDEAEYKKAVIIFYETNSLDYFKKLFVEQFNFAIEKYF